MYKIKWQNLRHGPPLVGLKKAKNQQFHVQKHLKMLKSCAP